MVQVQSPHSSAASLPAVDRVLRIAALSPLLAQFGHHAVVKAARSVLAEMREAALNERRLAPEKIRDEFLAQSIAARLEQQARPSLRPVFNLTGTVLHTNLGRAILPRAAAEAVLSVLTQPCNLEYDLEQGRRGDRDDHIEDLVCELTGAEAATIVNNNAAAVLLVLNTLAIRKEVIVSRGELIEIGGAFRIPDVMARAGCRLREVGTTNRTHLTDFEQAIGPRTAMLLKVHTSNYVIQGFTSCVPERDLAALAHDHGLPFAIDLGSGTLVDLSIYGLPREPTPQEALKHGADLVTFSGDKLLGGPQAGIIVGRRDVIARIKRNPLKRALRVDKMTIAALESVLRLYRNPDSLAELLPTLRLLTRPLSEIEAQARRLQPLIARALAGIADVTIESTQSQIGSGALPVDLLPSRAICIRPVLQGRGSGAKLKHLAAVFRHLPVPVIGAVADGALRLDLRCLEDEAAFCAQIAQLRDEAAS